MTFHVSRALEFSQDDDRLLPMEGLRGLAVLLVFMQHYFTLTVTLLADPGVLAMIGLKLAGYGNLGVELFFVLSGYLIPTAVSIDS